MIELVYVSIANQSKVERSRRERNGGGAEPTNSVEERKRPPRIAQMRELQTEHRQK